MTTAAPSDFNACLAFVWAPDNDGAKEDSSPSEGFATAYGITQMTWDNAAAQGIVSGDLSNATQTQCATILRVMYYNAMRCAVLPPGVNLMMFNDGMVTGVGHAARMLQRILGTNEDGEIGLVTTTLAGSYGTQALIDAIAAADETYYAALANAPLYLRGWVRREGQAQVLAYQMAGITASAA
jgi:lysozyme family protein